MLGGLSRKSMGTMVYIILKMTKLGDEVHQPSYDFLYDEVCDFIEDYELNSSHEEIKYIHTIIAEELKEGTYLDNGLDSFNESVIIMFRDKIYKGNEDAHKVDPMYHKIIDIAEEVYSQIKEYIEEVS